MGNVGSRLIAVLVAMTAGGAEAACAPDTLELRTGATVQRFAIEVADDVATRSQGLMFRESMPSSAGMLFVYEQSGAATFWMKNTLIPLDMIFADDSGRVTHLHSNAIPQDLTPINGGSDVRYVLEINGGLAKRMGLTVGSEMRAAAIEQSDAIWPCSGE